MAFLMVMMFIRLIWFVLDVQHPGLQQLSYGSKTHFKRTITPEITILDGNENHDPWTSSPEREVSISERASLRLVTALKKPTTMNSHPKDFSVNGQHPTIRSQANILDQKPRPAPFERHFELETALEKVITTLPGEMNMRDLLRPVEGTGKEKLHEMGLRTRSYRDFLQAWESLHFATNADGSTYIRDDIVQYLTQLGKVSDFTSTASGIFATMSTAQIIHGYETYKYFLAKFGQLLFPYTSPFFPDHMSLHLQFKSAGRGIVLTAGDGQAHFLMTNIYSFRESCLMHHRVN